MSKKLKSSSPRGEKTRSIRTPRAIKRVRKNFLESLSENGNVTLACKRAGLPRATAYNWFNNDEEFATEWEKSVEMGVDALEDEAIRRGFEGYEEPVFYQGKKVADVRRYSDTLLIFMLKGRRPEKFKDSAHKEFLERTPRPIEHTKITKEMSSEKAMEIYLQTVRSLR